MQALEPWMLEPSFLVHFFKIIAGNGSGGADSNRFPFGVTGPRTDLAGQ